MASMHRMSSFAGVFLVFFSCHAFSQDGASTQNTSPKNGGPEKIFAIEKSADANDGINSLFSEIEKMMTVGESVEGRFQQSKFISVLPKPLLSKGIFGYNKDSGLDWLTQAPIVSRLVFNDQGIRQDVEGNTVWEVDGMQPAVLSITRVMTGVLSGNWQVLSEYFDINGQVDAASWQLTMTPKDDVIAQLISSLTVDGKQTLKKLTLFEANGDRTEISFTVKP